MKQFDVYANPSRQAANFAPALVILSSDLLTLEIVMVAPLLIDLEGAATQVDVTVQFEGRAFVVSLPEMVAAHPRSLRRRLGTFLDHEYELRRGLERLFTGF